MNVRVMSRLGRTAQERLRDARRDDGVAMVIVLLMIMVILGLTVTLVSTLVATPPAIYLAERGTKTIYAAQAGLQAAVGQLRNTPTYTSGAGTIYPNPGNLPCSVTGTVDGSSSYSATITYYNANPAGQTAAWLASSSYIVPCTTGSGTTTTPSFALIRSSGIGAAVPGLASTAGVRILQAIYGFNLSNVNIPGGPIYDNSQGYCMTATSASAGSLITYVKVVSGSGLSDAQKCPNATLMNWVYNTGYQLQLASTIGTSTPLCISGGTTTANVKLQACANTTIQKWAWTGAYTWLQGSDTSNNCLGSGGTVSSGTTVKIMIGGCNGTYYPSPAVGPGGAGYSQHQIVNFLEFGRCVDVTAENINNRPYIDYPCKQDPSGAGGFTWNQKWAYTEPPAGGTILANQQITTNPSGTPLCLTTTATSAAVPAYPSNYVYFTSCSTGATNQKWTRVGNTGEFASSYLLQDGWGHCLDLDRTHLNAGWSTIVVAACSGQNSQKWNAVAATTSSTLGSYQEIG
jgi:Tfp pilus assembly protein PilX